MFAVCSLLRLVCCMYYGYYAEDKPVHFHDLHATILHLMGIDHEEFTYRYAGRDFRLTDVEGKVVHEILA